MKKITLFLLLPVLLLSIGCAPITDTRNPTASLPAESAPESAPAPDETAPPDTEPAPDFTVYDKEGNPVSLTDLRGKPVVLNFWASWCGPCKGEMPEFEAAYQELGSDVVFMMINVTTSEQSREDPEKLIADQGYTFPVYYDLEGTAASVYGISAFPTTFFIGAEGEPVAYAVGAIDGSTLLRGIAMARGEDS